MRCLSLVCLMVLCQFAKTSVLFAQESQVIPSNQVVIAANELAFRLDRHFESEGNSFYSPASVASALLMAYAGSRGETAAEFAEAMDLVGLGPESQELDQQMAALLQSLNTQTSGDELARRRRRNPRYQPRAQLSLVNRFWGQTGYPFEANYSKRLADSFMSTLQLVNFKDEPQAARETINNRISKDTAGKIKDLIPEDAITSLTRLVLTNAIYFKNAWADEFYAGATESRKFDLNGEASVEVPMMRRTSSYRLSESEDFRLVRIPYAEGRQSMLILLPKERFGLANVEKKLDYACLSKAIKSLNQSRVALELPRFNIERNYEIVEALKAMGIRRLFNPLQADLSGIDGGHGRLVIDRVIHKTYISVDEKGTEAAAATALVGKLGAEVPSSEPQPFVCDQPFLFFIVDEASELILFRGRCSNPLQ